MMGELSLSGTPENKSKEEWANALRRSFITLRFMPSWGIHRSMPGRQSGK